MKLRTLPDFEAILFVECPPSFRLALVVLALLVSHLLGMAWWLTADYEREVLRLDGRQEITELRNQVRHQWKTYEGLKKRLDKREGWSK